MNITDDIKTNTIELSIEKFRRQFNIDPKFLSNLTLADYKIEIFEKQIYQLMVDVCTDKYVDEKVITFRKPKNWWQHFKQDVFPKKLLKYFPVEYIEDKRIVTMNHLRAYPEIEIPKNYYSDKYVIHEFINEKKL